MRIYLFLLILWSVLNSAVAQSEKIRTIEVDPYLSFENYEHFKRLVINSQGTSCSAIDGFDFEWGYFYKLNIKENEYKILKSDGEKFSCSLVKVISKVAVSDTFQFRMLLDAHLYYYTENKILDPENSNFAVINDSTFRYFDKINVIVPKELNEDFRLILIGGVRRLGVFCFIDNKHIKLLKFI